MTIILESIIYFSVHYEHWYLCPVFTGKENLLCFKYRTIKTRDLNLTENLPK